MKEKTGKAQRVENPRQAKDENAKEKALEASYRRWDTEAFSALVKKAYVRYENCRLCPRNCGVNRCKGEKGFCRTKDQAIVSSSGPHFGEEDPLVGKRGSGTVFFANCQLRCVFCQNYTIAHEGQGRLVEDETLARMMLSLQREGCHNINLVTPTHVVPNILSAVEKARVKGLTVPICYNTSSYEEVETLQMLSGVVDLYLADMKWMDEEQAAVYAEKEPSDYPEKAKQAITEMYQQVGPLVTDDEGIAQRGLMLRHLVMPNKVAGTKSFVQWVANNLSPDVYVNIMGQYRPAHKATDYEAIARKITHQEFEEAVQMAREAGLVNLDERSISQFQAFHRRLFR